MVAGTQSVCFSVPTGVSAVMLRSPGARVRDAVLAEEGRELVEAAADVGGGDAAQRVPRLCVAQRRLRLPGVVDGRRRPVEPAQEIEIAGGVGDRARVARDGGDDAAVEREDRRGEPGDPRPDDGEIDGEVAGRLAHVRLQS